MTTAYQETIGVWGNVGRGFAHPVDVAAAAGGDRFYVLNRSTSWATPHGRAVRVTVVDAGQDVVTEFGRLGTEPGELTMPAGIAADAEGQIFVSDEHTHTISVFDGDGGFLTRWGSAGSEPGQLSRPAGLAVGADGTLWVVDHGNHRLERFSWDGVLQDVVGGAGPGPGRFTLPWFVTVAPDGHVWVSDWGNDRIQCLSPDGRCRLVLGGYAGGLFHRPAGITVDRDSYVYVSDWGRDRVVVLDPELRRVATWFGDSTPSGWTVERLGEFPEMAEARERARDPDGERHFRRPTAVTALDDGRVLVVDSCRHRIQVYRHTS